MPADITPISELTEEEGEDTEPGFTFNTQKASKRVSKIVQNSENKRQENKGARRDDLLDDMEFCLIKDLSDSRKKKKAKEANAEDLFCKFLAADLKEMPLYERLNAKNEIKGIAFRYQMSLLARQQSSSLQTERLSQTI